MIKPMCDISAKNVKRLFDGRGTEWTKSTEITERGLAMIEIDMKFPSCCEECFALDFYNGYPHCIISMKSESNDFDICSKRMPSCPMKENEPRVLTLEQEPIKVERHMEETEWNVCGNCGSHVIHKWAYCPYCGKRLKWDD